MNRPSPLHPVIRTVLLVLACLASAAPASLAFSISGTVRNPAAAPVADVDVLLYDDNGNPIGIPPIFTNAVGFYSIDGLPSGRYGVGFEPPTTAKLLALDIPQVDVNNANVTLDVSLNAGLLLSGFVRDGQGVPIVNIDLNVENRDTGDPVNTPGDNSAANGFYDVVVPSGNLRVSWRDVTSVPAVWIRVILDLSLTTDTTQDVTMLAGVHVSGVVRNPGGNPLANANLDFIEAATGVKLDTPGDVTTVSGVYAVHVPPQLYDIRVKPDPVQRMAGLEMLSVQIASSTTMNFTLQPGKSISGFVRRTGGIPVSGVGLTVQVAGTSTRVFAPNDLTDAAGHYEIFVVPGTYDVTFEPPVATLLVPQQVAGVVVSVDTPLSVNLAAGVLLSGTVVRATGGLPVVSVDVDARRTATLLDVPLVGDFTDAAGNYAVVVSPDTYDLDFEPPIALELVAVRMTGFAVGGTTSLPVTLQSGFTVTGTTTDAVGALLENTDVNVVVPSTGAIVFTPGDKTDGWGRYRIVIPGGTYHFLFTPDSTRITAPVQTLPNEVVNRDRILDVRFPALITTDAGEGGAAAPARFLALHQNRPNPFNPSTTIEFDLGQPGSVQIAVHDARGRLVREFRLGARGAGRHRVVWDGTDSRGRNVPSGTYFYRVKADTALETRKMVLVK